MTLALNKSRATFTAQANTTVLTAYVEGGAGDPREGTSYTGETPVTIDNTYDDDTENGRGSSFIQLELDVTTAQTTAGTAQIWWRGSVNNTRWTRWKYSHVVGETLKTSADNYDAGIFVLSYDYTQLCVVAIDYGMAATLYATPKLQEFI